MLYILRKYYGKKCESSFHLGSWQHLSWVHYILFQEFCTTRFLDFKIQSITDIGSPIFIYQECIQYINSSLIFLASTSCLFSKYYMQIVLITLFSKIEQVLKSIIV